MKNKSPTYDESVHLTAGYLALVDKDFSFSPENPPLIRSFAVLPLLFIDLKIPDKTKYIKQNKFKSLPGMFEFADNFVFRSENNADQSIFLSRLPIVFLSMVLGFFVFLWAKKLYGIKAGLFALVLYVFSPNILAHSRLVTTDLGVTSFMFIACYYFWCYLKEEKKWQYGLATLFTSFSLMSKYSAFSLFPIFILMTGAIIYEKRKYDHHFLTCNKGILQLVKKILIHALLFIIVFTGVIFVAYGLGADALILYKQGLTVLWKDYFGEQYINGQPIYSYKYLFGHYYTSPKWFCPIVVFLVKTPVPIFILFVLSLGLIQLKRKDLFNE